MAPHKEKLNFLKDEVNHPCRKKEKRIAHTCFHNHQQAHRIGCLQISQGFRTIGHGVHCDYE